MFMMADERNNCIREIIPALNWNSFNTTTMNWTLQNMELMVSDFAGFMATDSVKLTVQDSTASLR